MTIETIEGYTNIVEIEYGGSNKLFYADKEDNGLKCVAKTPRLMEMYPRFKREIEMLGQLNHPHIMPLLEIANGKAEDGSLTEYLIMPRYERTLFDLLKDEYKSKGIHMPLADVFKIGEQLSGALSLIHQRGSLHRDIKPENIFIDQTRNDLWAVLGDFNIAIWEQQKRLTVGGCIPPHTPPYAPLEQKRGDYSIPQTDVYALGAVLYELLTNQFDELCQYDSGRPIKPPCYFRDDISDKLNIAILRALEKEPHKRQSSVEELIKQMSGDSSPLMSSVTVRSSSRAERTESQEINLTWPTNWLKQVGNWWQLYNAESCYKKGCDHFDRGLYHQALNYYQVAQERATSDGKRLKYKIEMARAYRCLGQLKKAEKLAQECLNEVPDWNFAKTELSKIQAELLIWDSPEKMESFISDLIQEEKYQEAFAKAQSYESKYPNNPSPYIPYALGYLYEQNGFLQEACYWYRKAKSRGRSEGRINERLKRLEELGICE